MKKVDKEVVWVTVLISIFLAMVLLLSNKIGSQYPSYSVLNKSEQGYSIFYELLLGYDYPVERTVEPINDHKAESIQIITTSAFSNILEKEPEREEWINQGGILVVLSKDLNQSNEVEDLLFEDNLKIELESQGKGTIIKANSSLITNSNLLRDSDGAYKLLQELEEFNYEAIYFNEYKLFPTEEGKSLWDIIPLEIKMILYQLLLIIIAFFYYQGKRFGKAKSLYSEAEREENEYVYSAASLYRQAECWDLLVKYYYDDFLNNLGSSHDTWLQYWERRELPLFNKAKRVYQFMDNLEESPKQKLCIQIITSLEELKEIIKKRSDENWKRLKKNI